MGNFKTSYFKKKDIRSVMKYGNTLRRTKPSGGLGPRGTEIQMKKYWKNQMDHPNIPNTPRSKQAGGYLPLKSPARGIY